MDEIYFLRRCSSVEYVEFDWGNAKENPTPSTRTSIVMDGLESPWKSAEQNVPMARQNQRWWQVAPGCSLHIYTFFVFRENVQKEFFSCSFSKSCDSCCAFWVLFQEKRQWSYTLLLQGRSSHSHTIVLYCIWLRVPAFNQKILNQQISPVPTGTHSQLWQDSQEPVLDPGHSYGVQCRIHN